jgi:signal transduction histidine kinase/CheY-like chemotaxis protein
VRWGGSRWRWQDYGAAILAVTVAAAVRIGLLGALETRAPWLTFYPAVMIAGLYGGFAAGLLATVLTCLAIVVGWPAFGPQPFIVASADWLGTFVFVFNGVLISGITEAMRRARARAKQAEEEAVAANRAKSQFLSRMSHELRTPLNAILGFGQLLGMGHLDDDQREGVDHIMRAGRHLLDLINEVLDLSRIDTGGLSLSLEPVNVDELVADAVSLVGPMGAERRMALRSEREDAAAHVLADRQRVKQVLVNLLANAVKYSAPGSMTTVLAERAADGRIRITVADTGPGIAPEMLSRLFSPFDRLGAEAGATEGTGLGLALSKALVEAMGGTIGVESTVGVGSRFWFELPETQPVTVGPEMGADVAAVATERAPNGGRHGTILYVEDNLSNFRLIERSLALRANVRLLPAMLGRLGLDLAREHRPDLVLLDLHLPDMPGEELLAQLRADPATRDIPVVVLSADATHGQVERLLANGARAYLTKPLDIGEFLAVVDDVLAPGTP